MKTIYLIPIIALLSTTATADLRPLTWCDTHKCETAAEKAARQEAYKALFDRLEKDISVLNQAYKAAPLESDYEQGYRDGYQDGRYGYYQRY